MIRNDIGADQQYSWIANCKGLILPIDDGTICSGDTVLLTGFMLEKIVIVTKPSTLAEMYVQDRRNALLVPKEVDDFVATVQGVISGDYNILGHQAREDFLSRFSRESMGERLGRYINES